MLVCAISFAIIFSAYNTLQNYASTLFPGNLGQESLGVLYAVAGVTVFTGPALTHVFGTRLVMFGGALCYVVYLVSLIWLSEPLVLATSVIIGWGAAVLWIALGVFLTENSTQATYATNTGLFWSIFQFNNIIGNLTTYFVISNIDPQKVTAVLYLGFAVVAGVGTLGLLLLRPAKEEGGELEEEGGLLEPPSREDSNAPPLHVSPTAPGQGREGCICCPPPPPHPQYAPPPPSLLL